METTKAQKQSTKPSSSKQSHKPLTRSNSRGKSSQHKTLTNDLNHPGSKPVETSAPPIKFTYSAMTYNPNAASQPTTINSSSPRLENHSGSNSPSKSTNASTETYAKIRKTPSPRPKPTESPSIESQTASAKDNLAYIKEDESNLDSLPVPENFYGKPSSLSADELSSSSKTTPKISVTLPPALPPPVAFSDCDSPQRGDVIKDYIDIDKASLNNNNSDTLSFYSDNYVRPGALGFNRSKDCSLLNSSIYSPGSSAISINSFEVSGLFILFPYFILSQSRIAQW